MDLITLAQREEELLARIEALDGLMESKHEDCEGLGFYAKYRDIFSQYHFLLAHPDSGSEALKRVIFLLWYSCSEPSMFSGLHCLPAAMDSVYPYIERALAAPHPDAELRWMLSWYYFIADYAFPRLDTAPLLASFLAAARRTPDGQKPPAYPVFSKRGQMGRYWNSFGGVDAEEVRVYH